MSIEEISNLTQEELDISRKAFELDMLNKRYIASYSAFQNVRANGTDKNGRLVNKKFTDLFDYEKEYNNILFDENEIDVEEENKKKNLRKLLVKANREKR